MSFSFLSTFLRAALAALLIGPLAACVSITHVEDPLKLASDSALSPVVISVTTNTGEVRGFDDLSVYRVEAPPKAGEAKPTMQVFVLRQIAKGLSRDTSVFVGALPPGEYALLDMSNQVNRKSLRLEGKYDWIGSFAVKPRTPTDLGRLILTPVNLNVVVGRSELVRSNAPLLQKYAPEHARLFGAQADQGWVGPRGTKDVVEDYARSRPVGAQCATERHDGSVIAASRLGTVLIRSQDGAWRAARSKGLESLLCVTPADLPNAELLAVGEFGTLLRKEAGRDELIQVDTGNLPPGSLFGIAGNASNGWFVALQRDDEVILYHTAALESGTWNAVGKASVAHDFWNGANPFWMWNTPSGFAYTGATGPIRVYDYARRTWTERPTPGGARLISVMPGPRDSLGVLTSPGGGFAGVFAGVHFSTDQGATWRAMEVPYKIKFAPVQQTYDGTLLMIGGVMSKPELQISKDDGKTWSHLGPYDLGRQLLALKNGTLLDLDLGQYGIFSIRSSSDGGKNWEYEYSNFDKSAYDATKK